MGTRGALIIPVIINTVIFLLLSLVHFYWVFGGDLWYDEVLPTTSNGQQKLNPGTAAGLVVAFILLFFAFITAATQGLFDKYIKRIYFRYCTLFIAIVFLARAIGDFRFVGFFKIVKSTKFGINDTEIFSPLCLFIFLVNLLIFVFTRKK